MGNVGKQSTVTRVVMASGNAGKLRELAQLLAPLAIEVVPQSAFDVADADETGTTFLENAVIKARHAAELTGLPAVADDSGLLVDALDGAPGVYSARYAGADATDDDNIDKLLRALEGKNDRAARFACTAVFVPTADADPVVASGEWHGEILPVRRGDGGFGYDPVFLDPSSGLASAELTPAQKNARSHRGKALRDLVSQLAGRFG